MGLMEHRRLIEHPSRPVAYRSYDPARFARLFAVEDRHFWFRARNHIIASLVSQITASLSPGYRVLELGCGTGNTLRVLEQACTHGMVVGMDLFADGLQYARRRVSCPLVQGDVHRPPFGIQFDLIGLFDVLEHLPDDIQVLHDLHAMLMSAGVLILTVPAHPSLWSYRDDVAHHFRRYKLTELKSKLVCTGYRVEYLTQYMASILPLVWVGRRLASLFDRYSVGDISRARGLDARELRITTVVNDLLALLLAQEARVITRRRQLPIGISLLALARKDLSAR